MQSIWKHGLWGSPTLTTVDGRRITVLDRGQLNMGSGPDFFNAKIKSDEGTWAGNIEIHVNASDWYRHGHNNDEAYENVILHVVMHDDARITLADGREIPQVILNCSTSFAEKYRAFIESPLSAPPCAPNLKGLHPIIITDWMSSLSIARIQRKAQAVLDIVERNNGDWTEAIYITLARGLGFGANAQPMEMLATSIPLKLLLKHVDNGITTPALLLGRAGFLSDRPNDPMRRDQYFEALRAEYEYRCKTFNLKSTTTPQWKSSIRPANHPLRRIILLAQLMADGFDISWKIFTVADLQQARDLFACQLPEYWRTHYDFGHETLRISEPLGKSSLDLLVINVVVPILCAFAQYTGNDLMRDTAVDILHQISPERNSIISFFQSIGLNTRDAFDSQAIIELRKEYCEKRKCIFCRIGHRILSKVAIQS